MSKDKNKIPEEEPIKRDMSFEDAILLAMKTPPLMTMDLILNEEQEIRNHKSRIPYAGRIITFKQMQVSPHEENVFNFCIELRRTKGKSALLKPAPMKRQGNLISAFFTPWEGKDSPTITVGEDEQVFLTLRLSDPEMETGIWYARVAFSVATKAKA